MSGQNPPLDCRQVKRILAHFGFKLCGGKGSHENYSASINGRFRKVTVDCPKEPFTGDLLKSMVAQSGLTRKQWYDALEA